MSGGFAIVHPGSSLTINAVEAASLDGFSLEVSKVPFRLDLDTLILMTNDFTVSLHNGVIVAVQGYSPEPC